MYVDNPIRRARLARGMSLDEVAARTFLSPRIVRKIDDGAFNQLPGGVYARSWVRTFATLVGLDSEAVVEELATELPPAEDPLPVLRQQIAVAASCQFGFWDGWVRAAVMGAAAVRRTGQRLQARWRGLMATSICIAIPRRLFH